MPNPLASELALEAIANANHKRGSRSFDVASVVRNAIRTSPDDNWETSIRRIQKAGTLERETTHELAALSPNSNPDNRSLHRLLLGYSAVTASQLDDPLPIRHRASEDCLQNAVLQLSRGNPEASLSALSTVGHRAAEGTLLQLSTKQRNAGQKNSSPETVLANLYGTQTQEDSRTPWGTGSTASLNWTINTLCEYSPDAFEKLVAALFSSMGYETIVSQYSKDNGIDVIATAPGGKGALIQVKRYAPGNNVSIDTIQRLRGIVAELEAPRGLVVTTADFTKPAIESAQRMDRLSLLSGDRLVSLFNQSTLVPSP